MKTEVILIIILLVLNTFSFLIGYLLGTIGSNVGVSNIESKPKSFFKKDQKEKKNIDINESKYVVNIDTKGMEKKYTELGEVKQSTDNIQNSVNKLKNMKG
jgi:hypothetical protein